MKTYKKMDKKKKDNIYLKEENKYHLKEARK